MEERVSWFNFYFDLQQRPWRHPERDLYSWLDVVAALSWTEA